MLPFFHLTTLRLRKMRKDAEFASNQLRVDGTSQPDGAWTRSLLPCMIAHANTRLSREHVPILKELLRVLGAAFGDRDTYQGAVPRDEYLRSLLANPQFIAMVAIAEGQVVGGLAAYVLEKFERERWEIYIYDLAVDERHRRRGIATGLINQLKNVARQCAAYIIYVQADKADDAAISLYESLGQKEDVFHFDIVP